MLVTGAMGFIGRRLVDVICTRGDRTVAVTCDPGKISTMWPDGSVGEFRADLVGGENLDAACRDVNTVFHLAGCAHAAIDALSLQLKIKKRGSVV